MAGATVTILLCLLVFSAWALREVWNLYQENVQLRASRLSLLEQVRAINREAPIPGEADTGKPAGQPAEPGASAELPSMTTSIPKPASQRSSASKYHIANGPTDTKTVSLTFDGSSLANITGTILDTLASRNAPATMFLTGEFIRKFPDITRRIVAAGFECGNHTARHPHLTAYGIDRTSVTLSSVNETLLRSELGRADDLFFAATGRHFVPLWRAPYGEYNTELCRWAYGAGYLHIGWRQGKTWREGLDSNDWIPDAGTDGFHTPAEFLDKVISLSRRQPDGINGGILLFHLGTERKNSQDQVHLVLGTLIDTLRSEGYRIVPVSEMVASTGLNLASIAERSHIQ